jgi:hypothetical protein
MYLRLLVELNAVPSEGKSEEVVKGAAVKDWEVA